MSRVRENRTHGSTGGDWKRNATASPRQPPTQPSSDQTAEFVIDAYHQLWRIEKSFRMSKHDLQARPIYHRTRESIEAHLSIVFAALAVSHWLEHQTGWSIKKFVRTTGRYRTVQIRAGRQIRTAAEPLPDDLAEALTKIRGSGAH